jgi:hypothetical protein
MKILRKEEYMLRIAKILPVIGLAVVISSCGGGGDDPKASAFDVTGEWSFSGTISHNNCAGFYFLPVGTPRDLQLSLKQNGTQVAGSRTGGSFWSLVEGVLVDGTNVGDVVSLKISNPVMAAPLQFTWDPKMTSTNCSLQLAGAATLNFTSSTTATGNVSAPVTYISGDCGVWIQPLPCDMTVTGQWTKKVP